MIIDVHLARMLIQDQFPKLSHLPIVEVTHQGHDNRSFRLGKHMLIRMPSSSEYAIKVCMEQEFLPKLAPHLTLNIPTPLYMGVPSHIYPHHFSIYQWCPGKSLNLLDLNINHKKEFAYDLAVFLKELQNAKVPGPGPGSHNFWRGGHLSIYTQDTYKQIKQLSQIINSDKALDLWENAHASEWQYPPVWVHGDIAIGNIIVNDKHKLFAIIDFGCSAVGDPACDLAIAWTYLSEESRDIFINTIQLDDDVWLRARAWALWKSTFELRKIIGTQNLDQHKHKKIIDDILSC
jgi:aminoglycoside phosphotransferase (APT) family kinase protein